jgi:hypothetical protein
MLLFSALIMSSQRLDAVNIDTINTDINSPDPINYTEIVNVNDDILVNLNVNWISNGSATLPTFLYIYDGAEFSIAPGKSITFFM